MKKIMVIALAAASCLLGSGSALAAYVTDTANGVLLGSWTQSLTPTVLSYQLGDNTEVAIFNATGAAAGYPSAFWYAEGIEGGGLQAGDPGGTPGDPIGSPINSTGPQSYVGSEAAPVFIPGVYHEDDGTIVTISVPEPATWAMMITGLGMAGWAARRRRHAVGLSI